MALQYKLEFLKNDTTSADSGVYIHLRQNVPIYVRQITKESYETGSNLSEWMTGIFNIGGVTDASSLAYRVWVVKSPVFTWDEVITPLLYFIMDYLGEKTLEELPGSGITLNSATDRRS